LSHPGKFERGSPLVSAIYSDKKNLPLLEMEIKEKWGRIILSSVSYPFRVEYYQREMGERLWRKFYLTEGLYLINALVEMKLWAYGFEVYTSRGGRRSVNIDPGLLFTPSLIIATFKPYSHRVPLEKGVYAHLELEFSRGKPRALPWTYPDFASGAYNPFLEEAWKRHRAVV